MNSHGLPDVYKEVESINFDLLPTCILSTGGLTTPGSGLSMPSVSAKGYVRRGADLLYVEQPAQTVTVSSTAGSHWLALTADTWTALAGWTRIPGSHFVEQANATQPTAPDGAQLVTGITVTAGNITAVTPVLSPPLSRQNSNNVDITGGRIAIGGHAPTGVLDVQGSVVASDLANFYPGVRVWPVAPGGAQYSQALRVEAVTGAGLATTQAVGLAILAQPGSLLGAVGLQVDISGGTNRYNIYAGGTAQNYFAGNVGIGNAAPSYPLDVTGNVRVMGQLGLGANPSAGQIVYLDFNKASVAGIVLHQSGNDTGSGQPVFFTNVGGGTIGSITTTGAATSFNTSSDVRLKHAVQALSNALSAIQALRPVRFRWNATDQADEGFLAHELQQVMPHAVTGEPDAVNEDGSVRPQQVDHSKLVVWLVAGMQELLTRIEALEGA